MISKFICTFMKVISKIKYVENRNKLDSINYYKSKIYNSLHIFLVNSGERQYDEHGSNQMQTIPVFPMEVQNKDSKTRVSFSDTEEVTHYEEQFSSEKKNFDGGDREENAYIHEPSFEELTGGLIPEMSKVQLFFNFIFIYTFFFQKKIDTSSLFSFVQSNHKFFQYFKCT